VKQQQAIIFSQNHWLEVSVIPKGNEAGHIDRGFLGFPLSLRKL
jgi:hypothetical protein